MLLSKKSEGTDGVREPLYYVVQLLHGKNVHPSVVNMVLGILEHLLRSAEELQDTQEELQDGQEVPLSLDGAALMPRVQSGVLDLSLVVH